jgi:hypothetical protein
MLALAAGIDQIDRWLAHPISGRRLQSGNSHYFFWHFYVLSDEFIYKYELLSFADNMNEVDLTCTYGEDTS